jgi:hypothetical protein
VRQPKLDIQAVSVDEIGYIIVDKVKYDEFTVDKAIVNCVIKFVVSFTEFVRFIKHTSVYSIPMYLIES